MIEATQEKIVDIKSSAEGTFHLSSDLLFVEPGLLVDSETVMGTVEYKALFANQHDHIKAGIKGRIVKKLVTDGSPVDCGQVLFKVEPV